MDADTALNVVQHEGHDAERILAAARRLAVEVCNLRAELIDRPKRFAMTVASDTFELPRTPPYARFEMGKQWMAAQIEGGDGRVVLLKGPLDVVMSYEWTDDLRSVLPVA